MERLWEAVPDFLVRLDRQRRTYRQERIERYGLKPNADCPTCGDTGKDPATDQFCWCQTGQRRENEARRERSWAELVPVRVRYFRLHTAPDEKAAEKVTGWVFRKPWATGQGLFLVGPPGTGKTGLAIGALHEAHMQGVTVGVVNVPDWLDIMRPTTDLDRSARASHAADKAARARLLLLDDLGTERVTEWVAERMYVLVNRRYDQDLPTIVTTNATRSLLEGAYGSKVIDRLTEGAELVTMSGPNLRRPNA